MSRKKKGRLYRMDRYLNRNSYFYKWGRKVVTNPWGRLILLFVILAIAVQLGYRAVKTHQVTRFLHEWEQNQHRQDYAAFIQNVDMSDANPDRASFPDWRELLFSDGTRMSLKNLAVEWMGGGIYRARAVVVFTRGGEELNRFNGEIFVRENDRFQIIRVET